MAIDAQPSVDARCIHELINKRAADQPSAPAIEAHDGSYSYLELFVAASSISTDLQQYGVHPGARVAILMEKSALYPACVLAVLMLGASFVPLDPSHPTQRLEQLSQDTRPTILISSKLLYDTARSLHHRVLRVARGQLSRPTFQPSSNIPPSNPAYIIHTSGSTGKPKGVVISHGAFVSSALARGKLTGLGPGARVLQYASHAFDVSVDEILDTLIHGACVCIPSDTDRFDIVPIINKLGVNHALLTPTSAMLIDPRDVPGLRTLQMGGELLTDEVIERWGAHARVFNVYGPTEASVACIMREMSIIKGAGRIIGHPVGCVCYVVDPENHNHRYPPDTIGELVVGGPGLATCYLDDPSRTKAAFFENLYWATQGPRRFYKTGDLASMSRHGAVTIHGRKDNQIKLRGQRMNVEEIEQALLATGILQHAVVALPKKGPLQGKLTAVVCLLQGGFSSAIDPSVPVFECAQLLDENVQVRLLRDTQKTLTSAMLPAKWVSLPRMPQSSSTKVDRKLIINYLEHPELPFISDERPSGGPPACQSHVHGRDSRELVLLKLWSRVLDIPLHRLRSDVSFVRNGGDSISAMELRRRAKAEGIQLQIKDILFSESIPELLSKSRQQDSETGVTRIPVRTGTAFGLNPVQQLYFDVTGDGSGNFIQSVLLELKEKTTASELENAIAVLVRYHPTLSTSFWKEDGTWLQAVSGERAPTFGFEHVNTTAPTGLDELAALQTPHFRISSGGMVHVQFVECDNGRQYLRIGIHHLVIDLISWRIILQDLESLIRGEPLPEPTMSFQEWCLLEKEYAATLKDSDGLPYTVPLDNLSFWSLDNQPVPNSYASTTEVGFTLSESATQSLLGPCNEHFRTQPVELLLASFFNAFSTIFTDRETPSVFVESHGREPWHPSIDVSRTVGWFTSAYPLHVPASVASDVGAAARHTSRLRRSVPANGHPYWCTKLLRGLEGRESESRDPMEFVFNFSGQFQQIDRDGSAFARISRVGEETADPDFPRFSLFDMVASVEGGSLHVDITFPKAINHAPRFWKVVQTWKEVLQALTIERPKSDLLPGAPLECPSGVITSIATELRRCGLDPVRHVQSVYRPSDLQQHMLHSRHRDEQYYTVKATWQIKPLQQESSIDTNRIRDAWHQVVEKHANLRTGFVMDPVSQQFWAVTLTNPTSAVTVQGSNDRASSLDREGSTSGHQDTLQLSNSMVLTREGDGSVLCTLAFNHAVIDAASGSILLQDLADFYSGKSVTPENTNYEDYLVEIASRRSDQSFPEPSVCVFPTHNVTIDGPEKIFPTTISKRLDAACLEACNSEGLSVSDLVFTAWALILSHRVSLNQVSFAYVANDRSVDVPGIETATGMYVDLLLCNVDLRESGNLWGIAKSIKTQRLTAMCDPAQRIQASAHHGNGHASGVVNTMVNIRNTGLGSLDVRSDGFEICLREFVDPWDYDLNLAVDQPSRDELKLTLDYRNTSIGGSVATAVAEDLSTTLDCLLAGPHIMDKEWKLRISS